MVDWTLNRYDILGIQKKRKACYPRQNSISNIEMSIEVKIFAEKSRSGWDLISNLALSGITADQRVFKASDHPSESVKNWSSCWKHLLVVVPRTPSATGCTCAKRVLDFFRTFVKLFVEQIVLRLSSAATVPPSDRPYLAGASDFFKGNNTLRNPMIGHCPLRL